jgi:3-hydroxyisobutyrate dehydrogenase
MAERLARQGHRVALWNRTAERAEAVARSVEGVQAFASAADAAAGPSAVLTVLRDGDAVADVMAGVLERLDRSAVWIQASTIGPTWAAELARRASDEGVAYLDAPVSGSTEPARQGSLIWLVSGTDQALERARPVLDDLGSRVVGVGDGVQGSALKLAVNAWMTAATVAMSDVAGLCDALGVNHGSLVQALSAGALAMPYALAKLEMMDEHSYPVGFAVQLALKDLDLARQAVAPTPLLEAVHRRLAETVAAGHGADDLAAVDALRATTST